MWLGLPLALVLDHVDGDPTNNRRENLRLVCPNCDSQLPTYKSRNRATDATTAGSDTPTGSRTRSPKRRRYDTLTSPKWGLTCGPDWE